MSRGYYDRSAEHAANRKGVRTKTDLNRAKQHVKAGGQVILNRSVYSILSEIGLDNPDQNPLKIRVDGEEIGSIPDNTYTKSKVINSLRKNGFVVKDRGLVISIYTESKWK